MNKFYIVENLEFDKNSKHEKEIEDLNFKRDNAIGVWSALKAKPRMRESFKTL